MHRWTPRRSRIAAAALTTFNAIVLASSGALAEPGGGTLGANHEAAIEVAVPASLNAPAVSDQPRPEHDARNAAAERSDDADTGAGEPSQESTTAEKHILLGADHDATRDAHTRMTGGRGGPASASGEQSLGLMNSSDNERGESRLGSLPGTSSDMIQVIGALAIVITLLIVFRFVMVRASGAFAGGRPSGVLEILARYPVARGQHLALIKLGRRILLVHQNGSAMNTLCEVSDADEVAALLSRVEAGSSGRDAERFRSILNQYQREHETAGRRAEANCNGPASSTRDSRGEIVDLTRSQMGGLRHLFGGKR